MKKIKLKGGSLAETCLIIPDKGFPFVRKSVSLTKNRVYGFQRWYSQLKRIQRYEVLFPGVFPKIIKYGRDNDNGYFDIEYYENGINAHEYLEKCKTYEEVDIFFDSLISAMKNFHLEKITSSPEAIELYIYEEIEQKIKDCSENKKFIEFSKYDYIVFNGQKVSAFSNQIEKFKKLCLKYYVNPLETFTHGNITLENLLYLPDESRFVFIDPYEENIIDSILAEYSQILQSSNSKYEIYNRQNDFIIEKNIINVSINDNQKIDYFNLKFINFLKKGLTKDDYIMTRLLEVSQFIRMLPFKMEVDEKKMIFFYGLASKLFEDLLTEIKKELS